MATKVVYFEFTIDTTLAAGLVMLFRDLMEGGPRALGISKEQFKKLPQTIATVSLCSEGFRFLGTAQESGIVLRHNNPILEAMYNERRKVAYRMTQKEKDAAFNSATKLLGQMRAKMGKNITVVVKAVTTKTPVN